MSDLIYEQLSPELEKEMIARKDEGLFSYACKEETAIRRDPNHDKPRFLRPAFTCDIDKIMHCPFFNRYADKTQVFSFYKNDDVTRRALHVQLVSRIARNLGKLLHLNLDLIEAIALGHDIGHPPFAHTGETYLDELYAEHTGRHFSHSIHSVRVLSEIYPYNITLQTLDGIAAHNGEMELSEYRPKELGTFADFDRAIENCYVDPASINHLIPGTLEGCVVRIADIIAYIGKDRQDARRTKITDESTFSDSVIGTHNAEIINNMIVNLVENSFGKPYLRMDEKHFAALQIAKKENYERIYKITPTVDQFDKSIKPMMHEMYEKLLSDLVNHRTESPIFRHHIATVNKAHYERRIPYEETEKNQIVVDYIASMTDDYFIDLYHYLFPDSPLSVHYFGYFEKRT